MVGSRVSSRIASRIAIKQEQQDPIDDYHHQSPGGGSGGGVGAHPMVNHRSNSSYRNHPTASETTPKKQRRTLITSSPSSVEEDDVFDNNSVDDIDDFDDDDEDEIIVANNRRSVPRHKRFSGGTHRQKRADSELDSARNKLGDLLAHISKGDSQEDDEFDDEDGETDSSPHLKRRRSHKHKKPGKTIKEESYGKTSTFVLKLFDRSVDLAQFSHNNAREDAPLYPVCRAWIRNNTQLPNLYESPEPEEYTDEDLEPSGGPIDEKPSGIYHLPKPLPRPVDESGIEIDLRIPESVRNYKKPEISQADTAINSLVTDNFSTLLAKNMTHWKKVRQEWQQSSLDNELRYKHSCDVLKAMFEKTMNGQPEQFKPQTMDTL
ncbi:protein lin-37 homolog [Oppia nitens]|uniref:protein lin-37 homolog n=1 Tax=Oppia nitens TaxID=1686743 RepID=UPI0023DA1294|nr:protein lin-37 homolog [Oppia nitens]XP_054163166.1 protein lin-37 homolog [Oppia nitens]